MISETTIAIDTPIIRQNASETADFSAVGVETTATITRRVAGEGTVADVHRTLLVREASAGAAGRDSDGRVVGEGTVADVHRTLLVKEPGAFGSRVVVGEGAVADVHRPQVVKEAGAFGSRVVGDGAVVDIHCTLVVVEATACAVAIAISNGKSIQGETRNAVDDQHSHAIGTIQSDALPAAVQRQACCNIQGLRQLDVATATKVDGLSTGCATDVALQLSIVGTAGNGDGTKWLGMAGNVWFGMVCTGRLNMERAKLLSMGRATGQQVAREQAEP